MAHEAELARVTADRDRLAEALRELIDPSECRFDHHGGCQEHGFLEPEPGEVCPHAKAKQLLADLEAPDA